MGSSTTTAAAPTGDLPTFRYAMTGKPGKVMAGGSAWQATVEELPISESLAGVLMDLEPGGVRELHWHANAAEWGFVLAGAVRVTVFDPEERLDIADVGTRDVFSFPRGYAHAIQNPGPDRCRFLLVFDNGRFSEFATFSVTDWVAHTPPTVLAATLGVPASDLAGLPTGEVYIAPGPLPPPLGQDRPASPQRPTPLSHAYAFHDQPTLPFAGGTLKVASAREFPASTTITGAVMTIAPGGVREPHWHPNAAEWFFVVDGSVRVTLFGSQGRARTEQFGPGDVGYAPMGYGHCLENTGETECRLVLAFNSGAYEQIGLSGWLAANPRQLVASTFGIPLALADRFRDGTAFIASETTAGGGAGVAAGSPGWEPTR
jgi:oxalate decarboxylase